MHVLAPFTLTLGDAYIRSSSPAKRPPTTVIHNQCYPRHAMQRTLVFLQVSASISDVSVSVSYTMYAPKVPKASGYHSHPAAVRRRRILTPESAFWSDLTFSCQQLLRSFPGNGDDSCVETIVQGFMLHGLQLARFYQTSNFRLALALISP